MKYILSVLGFVCIVSAANAETFYVQDAAGVGVSKDDSAAVTELVRSAVGESKNQVVSQPNVARYTLRPKVMKLGNAYMLSIEKVENGQVKFASQMKSTSIEELDKVSKRLVRAVIDEVSANSDARVEDVTENEIATGRRRETLKRWYLGMGPAMVSNINSPNALFEGVIAYGWDMPSAQLKLFLESAGGDLVTYGIGGHYYFNDKDISPIVGATFAYGVATKQTDINNPVGETTSGFVLGGNFGYHFFRTSNVALEILGHVEYLLNKNSLGYPLMYGVRVGIYF